MMYVCECIPYSFAVVLCREANVVYGDALMISRTSRSGPSGVGLTVALVQSQTPSVDVEKP